MITTFGMSPYPANTHNEEMLRRVHASRLEKRLRKGRIRREPLEFEGTRRRRRKGVSS